MSKYYWQHRKEICDYVKQWRKDHPEKVEEYRLRRKEERKKTYNYKRGPYKGYFIFNDSEEKFFMTYREIQEFLGEKSRFRIRKLLDEDLEINGWKGERVV